MNKPITLPITTIQHDFQSVIIDIREGTVPFEEFWISCYKLDHPSVHGRVRVELDESDRTKVLLNSRDGVKFQGQGDYSIMCPQLGIPQTNLTLPRKVYSSSEPSDPRRPVQITAFDVSPDGSQFATGYNDGTILIRSARGAKFQNTSRPHVSTLTSLRFFPSSQVLLTAGADFSLTIVAAEPVSSELRLSPARVLKGHSRSITDTAIISRGRNILSCAKDGTIRLWDVSGGQSIRTLGANQWSPVLSMSLGTTSGAEFNLRHPDGEPLSTPPPSSSSTIRGAADSREVDTADKLVFCALSNGSLEAFDLESKLSVHRAAVGSRALNAVSYSPSHNLVAAGSVDGIVTIFDTRVLSTPVTSFIRNSSSIEDLAFTKNTDQGDDDVGVAITTEDGLPYIASIRPEGPTVLSELVGSDCDAARVVRVAPGGDIWTAGDDGIVRRY